MNQKNAAHMRGSEMPPHEEQRRSWRVTRRVAVKLHITMEGKPSMLRAFTASVNDRGTFLIAPESYPLGARFILEQEKSHERIGCRITHKPQLADGGFQIPVKFDRAAPGFWRIAFPAADWKAPEP